MHVFVSDRVLASKSWKESQSEVPPISTWTALDAAANLANHHGAGPTWAEFRRQQDRVDRPLHLSQNTFAAFTDGAYEVSRKPLRSSGERIGCDNCEQQPRTTISERSSRFSCGTPPQAEHGQAAMTRSQQSLEQANEGLAFAKGALALIPGRRAPLCRLLHHPLRRH